MYFNNLRQSLSVFFEPMMVYDNNESRMVVMSQECLLIIAIVREIINNRVRQGSLLL